MTKATSVKQIINKIGEPNLSLQKGEGYWYFVYDDNGLNFETYSVPTMYLNSVSLEDWVDEAKIFMAQVKENLITEPRKSSRVRLCLG